jgi:pseudo-rSAM protein
MSWNYPVNPQSKEWKNLKSTEEQFEAYNIPSGSIYSFGLAEGSDDWIISIQSGEIVNVKIEENTLFFYPQKLGNTRVIIMDSVQREIFSCKVEVVQGKTEMRIDSLSFNIEITDSSLEDCKETEQIIEQYQIEKYQLNPVYTGDNIGFFEENVFLTKEDILFTSMSIKDIFSKQAINMHDFGKINIMPNGDVYANLNHPLLGNIYANNIHEILHKEVEEGKSWLRVRNQVPCNTCIYQWICPSPSDYEIAIGYPNLCHVK